MATRLCSALLLLTTLACISAFSGDDKFIKKYAMMKVYESCFGPEVVKEVRKEMKLATAKCSGLMPSSIPIMSNKLGSAHHQATPTKQQLIALHQLAQQQQQSDAVSTNHVAATSGHSPHKTSPLQVAADAANKNGAPAFDLQKLQQAILDGYNKHVAQQTPAAQQSASSPSNAIPVPYPQQQFRPYVQQQQQQQPAVTYNSIQPLPAQAPYPPQYAQSVPAPTYPMYYPSNGAQQYSSPTNGGNQQYANPTNGGQQYSSFQQQPFYSQMPSGYFQPQPSFYQQPFYGGQRASRDLDIRGQLETLTTKMESRVRNVTCVMQELGYLDEKLEPAYDKMVERINRLPVTDDLKRDMADGVEFCRQFSQCVPEERKDKLAREMVRPMFFFRCYKHKKLEACIMKDVRDRYTATEEMSEDSLPSGVGAEMRSMRNQKQKTKEFDETSMETAIYEFLYGGGESILDMDMPL